MSDPIQIITVSQGTPGAPGSQIYTGAGIPSPTLGGQGDFYLNVTNGDVYQKNLGTWGTPAGNIRGPQGIQGIQGPVGSQIYTGGGAPSSGQGVTGDFYLNTLNGDYYSRSGGGWGSPVGNLTGPQGPQGIQGPVGSQILTGTGAPSGLTGVNGDIYIDNSNGNYYKKVSGSWVLQGTLAANSMRFISGWNANTNTPTLASGMGGEGDAYLVTTAGTTTLDGLSSWEVNDVVFFTQGAWRKMAVNQQKLSEKGQANGYAGLDSGGKVPLSQLPSSVVGDVQYQGAWNASTNTPSLSSGVGTQGQYYVVSVAGTHTLDGISSWAVGDWAIFNGSVWQKVDNNNLVQSVNSKQGVVVLTTDDVAEGVTNEYFTTARAKAAAVEDAIVSGHHDTAPSGDSVATALAGKLPTGTTTDGIPEGSTNLYFTAGRAQTAAVENAINSGTTNKAPSEDAVFTALAGKQASGNYMTGTTGDVVSTGPGTVAATIQTGVVTDTKGALATKPACAVVATSNQSLSGLPTIDGVSVADGTLVLLSAQTSPSQNGPWIAHSGSWTRPTWFPTGGTTQAFQFITVLIRLGTTYQGTTWRMTTSGPLTIDTDAMTWVVTPFALNSSTLAGVAAARSALGIGASSQFITSGTTFTTPSNITSSTRFKFTLIGGGGAGGGSPTTTNAKGAGGGAGATCIALLSGLAPSTAYTIAIGAGGAGASNATGGSGGSTTLTIGGTTYTAGGGAGGAATVSTNGGAGGTATNGTINVAGGQGGYSSTATSANGGGDGAGSGLWGPRTSGLITSGTGAAAVGYGSGGAGAFTGASGVVQVGGAGSQGAILVEWWD